MDKLFEEMTLGEKLVHVEKCRRNAIECVKRGEPSCLADILDQMDIWMPWALSVINQQQGAILLMKTALKDASEYNHTDDVNGEAGRIAQEALEELGVMGFADEE